MANPDQHLIDKLSFWHSLEFFIPFDLDNRAREQDNQKKLWRPYKDTTAIRFDQVPAGLEVARYTLFLGVFDKGEVRDIVRGGKTHLDALDLDEEQGADLEGLTCMASIELTPDAEPLFDTFQISTLPWALGKSRTHALGALSSDAFQQARSQLARRLKTTLKIDNPPMSKGLLAIRSQQTKWIN